MKKLDDSHAVEVADGIWWIGFADYEAGFSNNPYLLVDGDEGVLFDPGPGHPVFRDIIVQKIQQVVPPEKIRYIVLSHQDPDLCGLVPFIENTLHPDLVIIAHPRTSLFIPYYGVRKGILPVGDSDVLQLASGRRIVFYHTPYVHYAGNIVSYDEKTASLFSSDIFAVFTREWSLYADDSYIGLARSFIEHYIGGKEPVLYAYEKIKGLNIKRILPQHGGIIEHNIEGFLDMLKEAEPGDLLHELRHKPSSLQLQELLRTGKEWIEKWLKRKIEANALDDLMDTAMREGPATVSLLIDTVSAKSKELGVANPLAYGRVHRSNAVQTTRPTQLLSAIRKRFLSRRYGVLYGTSSVDAILQQGLISFKANVGVMFVDIRGFTKWSADKSPGEVIATLNKQHEIVSKVINSGGGRVNKVIGDGMLAYFPENRLSDCVTVATKVHKAVAENSLLPVGIGCDFGEVIMGDLGEESRLDYTLIGAIINFASRMCDSAGKGETTITVRLYDRFSDDLKREVAALPSFEKITVKLKPEDPETEAIKFAAG